MNPVWQEWLFWAMSATLLLLPAIMLSRLPAGRYQNLLRRWLMAIGAVAVCVLLILWFTAPHLLPHAASLGVYTLWILAASLIAMALIMLFTMPRSTLRDGMINGLLWFVGAVALVLGIIGAVLPVLPTTPFILITAACWARASPRFHRWLHRHRYFGPMVRNWEERRAIPKRGKYLAWGMMTISSIGLLIRFPERWYVGAGVGLVCLCIGLWMAKLPDA